MKLMNTAFEPARTPFDWLSRDNAEVDAFIDDPLCFPSLKAGSMESFVNAFPRLADPREIRNVRGDLPIYYVFSGSDDPVGQKLEGVRALVDRYRSAGITSITHDFYPGGRDASRTESPRRFYESARLDFRHPATDIVMLSTLLRHRGSSSGYKARKIAAFPRFGPPRPRSDLAIPAATAAGCFAGHGNVGSAEVTLVGEADVKRDVGERAVCLLQKLAGDRYASVYDVSVR
jgi:hypothetical protein